MLQEVKQYSLFIFVLKNKNKTETSTNAIGYPSQPDGKILLLKTPCTYAIKHEEINLVLN